MLDFPLRIHAIPALQDNYIWLLINDEKRQVIAVDPGHEEPVVNYLKAENLQLSAILITHHHWDHVNGVEALVKQSKIPVIGSHNNPLDYISKRVSQGETFSINSDFPPIVVLAVPGHTLDHIAYHVENNLFSGDTLFSVGCGRIFEGTPEMMYASLQEIASLPEETKIYCGHEYTLNNLRFAALVEPSNHSIFHKIEQVQDLRKNNLPSLPSNLKEEKRINPFLRCEQPEVVFNVSKFAQRSLNTPIEVFTELRIWKNTLKV